MAGHRFDPTVLREYDIRGVIGETLGTADALAVGCAFGTVVRRGGGTSICLGYDGRLSSPDLAAAVADGLERCGLDVRRIGLGPTPMLYYAVHVTGADGGIMVSGSHNPPDYNGFKFMLGTAAFFGDDIRNLGEIAAAGDYATGQGSIEDDAMLDRYVERLTADFDGGRALDVVWDAGNGAAGQAMEKLCAGLPGRHVLLNEKIDGTFPAHHPDPTLPENLIQLREAVVREGCDFGVAFDGDGDRIGAVDGEGRILWGDQLMILLAADVLATSPGATVIADVKVSQVFFDEIERLGGRPLMCRSGHSVIKDMMAKTGAKLAGEMSGHIFFADRYYGFDDALYAAVRLLECLSRGTESLAQMRDRLPQPVNTPELRFPCAETRKFGVVEEVCARLREEGADIVDVDGVRVTTADGWWLLRASNTEDVLVARCEAADQAGLERLCAVLSRQLELSGIEPPKF
jgi:phosphomannomutase